MAGRRPGGLTAHHSVLYSQQRAGYLPSKAAEGNYEGLVFIEGEAPCGRW